MRSSLRIGQGYDVHAFDDGLQGRGKVVIGGVMIPYRKGLIAHSDGDVLLHALCDALLGACALGDIGKHFPDTDVAYKNADSRALLRMIYSKIQALNYGLVNADMTVVAQAPKMAPYIEAMCTNIAADLEVVVDCINVKATTTEQLGFIGRKEGIAAQAVVLLSSSE
ncbi:2-C-methyl-D-erythritol 2,4-cyclodiphosphate synthase [Candidatus Endobugula sertula]|uniref:2-C-methyl-D-erythritol 2,4-cyclodiphosphate synthase n=1 Tax=Candidatus Endobugula sertula TaxID=62101 RepID=A0A1D2QM46_9GAMM|nr:2-C-methyl-D-erythritol 2,4-cyclodiphosphate synthase [Candidatus Endobugula sertula]